MHLVEEKQKSEVHQVVFAVVIGNSYKLLFGYEKNTFIETPVFVFLPLYFQLVL